MRSAMDEDVSTSKSESIYMSTVSVVVNTHQSEPTIQLWPCINVPSTTLIPQTVKDVYSKLASAASEIDQGMPNLLMSIVGTGNSFNVETTEKLTLGLRRLIGHCGLWVVSSGECNDPFACLLADVIRTSLSQIDNPSETLLIVANNSRVVYRPSQPTFYNTQMVDSRFNTLYILLRDNDDSIVRETLLFRCRLAMKLSMPPPALLIGVPDERSMFSTAQTPVSSMGPAIILPNTLLATEHKPLPIAIFCGASLESLVELREYVECGVPVLIVQDISGLCAVLRNSIVLYHSASFEHENFVKWLSDELRSISAEVDENYDEKAIEEAQNSICTILTTGLGDRPLLSFIAIERLEELPESILDLFIQSTIDVDDFRRILELAVKLDVPSIVHRLNIESAVRKESINSILEHVLANERSVHVLSAILDQQISIRLSSDFLFKWWESIFDKYFFQSIVLGSLLGYTEKPESLTEQFAMEIDDLLTDLSGGIRGLFPSEIIFSPPETRDKAQTIQIMATWALLLNQLELVKCFCAYASEPLGLSIVLAKIARSLAHESREWFFFEQRLLELSSYLCSSAYSLLSEAFDESPVKAYRAICFKSEIFNQLTLPQLAYETNTRSIIAHECCQRWALRLLYGNLQLRTLSKQFRLSNWLKIIVCSVFVVPIRWWVSKRPIAIHRRLRGIRRSISPTVTILEIGRQPKRTFGAMSTYSAQSGRSAYFRDDFLGASTREVTPFAPFDQQQPIAEFPEGNDAASTVGGGVLSMDNMTGGGFQSMLPIEDAESSLLHGQMETRFYRPTPSPLHSRKVSQIRSRQANFRDFVMFYTTPIVKYWLSLVFRLLYLTFFAYMLIMPGCLNEIFELIVWAWGLMWFCESIWVLSVRLQTSPAKQMRWRIFDVCLIGFFLIGVMIFRLVAPHFWTPSLPKLAYILKILWTYFLIYQCYSTLFVYIPMSDILGPFMVRIKLMITRDFFYYTILISLVVTSSIVAIKAVVYPDLNPNSSIAKEIFGWTWMSLFTTDLTNLKETSECKKFAFTEDRSQCRAIGGYGNPWCASQGIPANVTIYQFLVMLKLISWPILFALFARTAKEVDEEADHIWRYQLYSLAVDFSLRPFLPPPFTVLFFFCVGCRRMTGCISGLFAQVTNLATDHPDARSPHNSQHTNPAVYRNPSIPPSKVEIQQMFWGQSSVNLWKQKHQPTVDGKLNLQSWADKRLTEKLQLLVITNNFEQTSKKREKRWKKIENDPHHRLKLLGENKWTFLISDYAPASYSQPLEKFSEDIQRNVEDNVSEVAKYWRQLKLNWHISNNPNKSRLLSSDGLPLNPFGRTGLSGRGSYAKYGSNMIFYYVVFANQKNNQTCLLLSSKNELPKKWKHGALRSDEFLSEILTQLHVPDADIQRFAIRSHMPVGQVENNIAHVCISPLSSSSDTDNAWTEADIWSIYLEKPVTHTIEGYTWKPISETGLSSDFNEFVRKSAQIFNISM
ncbi:hypothetical protein M3Y94_00370000 [Aphelenchoides besseyi]|nr:hypothetical protein M3Y94_00370000 [Aphelenchoides besseyi]KAI6235184.1 hypothetical protein M3Y95_00024200 [Aphelenchoides besseyi]